MAFINKEANEIICKIVYFGPSLGGKTTNVQWVYRNIADTEQARLFTINNPDRTMIFDWLPVHVGEIRGLKTRLHLYTTPGQVGLEDRRRFVTKGLDGVVFVADSQVERAEENLESLRDLETLLGQQGYDMQKVPMVFQYNKRDLPNAVPLAEMRRTLNKYNSPDFEAVASLGQRVYDSLKTIAKSIITTLKGGEA